MKNLVTGIRDFGSSSWNTKKILSTSEVHRKILGNRSLHINKDLKVGDIIKKRRFRYVETRIWNSPFDRDKVIGIKLAKDIEKGTVLEWTHLQSK